MHASIENLFAALWQDYLAITPSAEKVHALLGAEQQQVIVNDHVAFRTFALPKTQLKTLAQHFEALGYEACGEYNFTSKKVSAKHYQHPSGEHPKVFISELRVNELSATAQAIIAKLVEQMDGASVQQENFLYSGRHWQLNSSDYKTLQAESEYASWLAAWGFRANHFTVSVNHLQQYSELADVNDKLIQAGFIMNSSGGVIKGGPDVYLAQSSTMADKVAHQFSDTTLTIPSCFYEFAQRYTMPNGELYQGFVEASADKIFESTDNS